MKTLLLLPLVLALPAYAGTSAKEVVAPASDPCITSWFAGASIGYLTELEEPMYNIHVGVTNSCWNVAGWNASLFLEVGYTQSDDNYQPRSRENPNFLDDNFPSNGDFDVDEMGNALQYLADLNSLQTDDINPNTSYDLDIVPITLNFKLERALSGNLNAYFGGGLGVAYTSLDIDAGDILGHASDSTWVFVGQVFGGLSYNISPAFEVYGGARWIYLADADFSGFGSSATLELGSDCLLELGARYKF